LILCTIDEMEWRLERLARTENIVAATPFANAGPALGPVLVREDPKASARAAVVRELPVRPIDPVATVPVDIDPAASDSVQIDPVRVPELPNIAAPQAPVQQPEPDRQWQPEPARQLEPPAQTLEEPQPAQPQKAQPQPAQPAKPWMDASRQPTLSPMAKLGRWLFSDPADPRRTNRQPVPGLVAHFFTGGAPHAHEVRDVSPTGLYVVTTERWYPGTVIRMTITKPDLGLSPAERSITIQARSVRWGNDGVGLEFVVSPPSKGKRGPESALDPIDGEQLSRFLKRLGARPN
jgi:hypothetical protein